jgi:hypothetical protein
MRMETRKRKLHLGLELIASNTNWLLQIEQRMSVGGTRHTQVSSATNLASPTPQSHAIRRSKTRSCRDITCQKESWGQGAATYGIGNSSAMALSSCIEVSLHCLPWRRKLLSTGTRYPRRFYAPLRDHCHSQSIHYSWLNGSISFYYPAFQ